MRRAEPVAGPTGQRGAIVSRTGACGAAAVRGIAAGLVLAAATAAAGCAPPGTRAEPDPRPPSRTATPPPERTGGPGDAPPNAADNTRWKQRHELSAAEREAADAAAARIRPALEQLRAAGDFAPEATRQALLDLGYRAQDIEVTPMREPPGAVYALHVGPRGCVIGDVRPDRVLVQVAGSAVEFGCLEPFSH
jgi:hypothetical protein